MPRSFPILAISLALTQVQDKERLRGLTCRSFHPILCLRSRFQQIGDRFRILLQATDAVRTSRVLLSNTTMRKFYVVVVYLEEDMMAPQGMQLVFRCLVMDIKYVE